MHRSKGRKPRPPLDRDRLNEIALFYVGRYATTRAKLTAYLVRKVRERGWSGEGSADIERLVERFAETGLVDDASFAVAKSRSLSERGYGAGRVRQALRSAGIAEADGAEAKELAAEQAVDAVIRFARRRRIGPFALQRPDRPGREKALAAMIRAGHGFDLSRAVVDLPPGAEIDPDELRSKTS